MNEINLIVNASYKRCVGCGNALPEEAERNWIKYPQGVFCSKECFECFEKHKKKGNYKTLLYERAERLAKAIKK